jgi:hypothetical protein
VGNKEIIMKQPHLILIISTVVIIISALTFVVFFNNSSVEGITAMRAKEIADEYAKTWNSSAVAQELRSRSSNEHGFADNWIVSYAIQVNAGENSSLIEFSVYSNNTVIEIPRSEQFYTGYNLETNWTIDSDYACQIADTCPDLKQWQSTYSDYYLESIGFGRNSYYSDFPICSISWGSSGFLDNPHSCRVIINAENSEIIEFEIT